MTLSFKKTLATGLLLTTIIVTGCNNQAPSPYAQVQKETTSQGASAVVKDSVKGGSLNRFFPPSGNGFNRVYTQEKKGFAEAKLEKSGKTLAMMSIADTKNNPTSVDKFKSSTKNIKGYPAVQQGSTATALLVNDRFQVKVMSRDTSFSPNDRETWLGKFDLNALAQMK
ncbi:MAG: hypothetical protein N5P05_003359 [Chroococcopsis gigantea SAG 12.99]|jgi:hypothetical protein|nr:hypothetical protein [Chlorogloea purpurea SAG 13.99]MDV3001753.1 hypothetical protein [Chroococcopsis gigantea SAG 12.99]